jgi:large subunit ribosomal protein L30
MAARLRVTLDKSIVGTTREARGTVRALGLHRIRQTVELPDSPPVRGMVRAVRYLVSVEEVADAPVRVRRSRAAGSPTTEESGS